MYINKPLGDALSLSIMFATIVKFLPALAALATLTDAGYNLDVSGSARIANGDLTLTSSNLIGSAGVTAWNGTAIPAGGTTARGFTFSSVSNFGVFFGSGAPSLSAAKGSLYLRSDGSATNNRAYVNTDGSTTWTAITTVA